MTAEWLPALVSVLLGLVSALLVHHCHDLQQLVADLWPCVLPQPSAASPPCHNPAPGAAPLPSPTILFPRDPLSPALS